MNELKAMRIAYGEKLESIGKDERIVVLDADLSHATMTCKFAEKYPDRFINCGIAEANMIGISVGLAKEGLIPIASSFAVFGVGRAFEQVRNSVAYQRANVKLCMTHAGITFAEDGGTHQSIEDIALMRVLPNMTIIVPSDANQVSSALDAAICHVGPVYVRIGRIPTPVIENQPFELGKANVLRQGDDAVFFACGIMVPIALEVACHLSIIGIEVCVVNVHTIKPIDEETIRKMSYKCKNVFTLEEHSVIGGLGDAVASLIIGMDCNFMKIGINDVFGQTGKPEELMDAYGLSSQKVYDRVFNMLNKVRKM